MYDHISALKDSTRVMNGIVGVLEKRLAGVLQENLSSEGRASNKEELEMTSSTKENRERNSRRSSQSQRGSYTEDGQVVNSIQYQHVFTPAIVNVQVERQKKGERK